MRDTEKGDYRDFLNGRRVRTWPYGTRYTGKVIHVDRSFVLVVVPLDGKREAFALTGVDFGGALGGYWDFVR